MTALSVFIYHLFYETVNFIFLCVLSTVIFLSCSDTFKSTLEVRNESFSYNYSDTITDIMISEGQYNIDTIANYKDPAEFRNADTVTFIFDGKGLYKQK